MELTDHLKAIRKYWWITVLSLLVCVGAAVYLTARTSPVYQSTLTFYVAASTETGTALQADEFAQRRINSYAGVLGSDLLATEIGRQPGVDLAADEVKSRISATVNPQTILLTVAVQDTVPERALRIAEEVAEHFGPLVSRLDSTDTASGADVSLTVISGPTLSPEPVSPRRTLNIGVAALAGLALGMALSIGRQMIDRSVRTPEDLKRATGLPVLAAVGAEDRGRRGAPRSMLIADAGPGSPRAEAYRQLRTNLTFSAVTNRLEVVVVTSALAGDGKTTTACNLAITLAESGRSVLLIEADMRRPRVAENLGLEGAAGLTNVLAGQVLAEDVIQTWGSEGLHVLAVGTLPPNPSELLGSEAMHQLVDQLRERYEVIVLDTPPVLPVTDATVVSAHADSVVLVVRHARTTRDDARAAVDALRAVGAPLAGAILNGVPATVAGGGYGYTSFTDEQPRRSRRPGLRRRRPRPTPAQDVPWTSIWAPEHDPQGIVGAHLTPPEIRETTETREIPEIPAIPESTESAEAGVSTVAPVAEAPGTPVEVTSVDATPERPQVPLQHRVVTNGLPVAVDH